MKALFVLHEGTFIYGSNRSITGVLQNVNFDYDLMVGQSFTKKVSEEELRKKFGSHLKNIYAVWVPRCRCQFFNKVGLFSECSHFVNNIMAFFYANKRKRIIRQGGYDYVHLNSLVLFPMVDTSAQYVLHAREIIDPAYKKINELKKALQTAAGVIYIDKATKTSVEKETVNVNNITINNPFDMTSVRDISYEDNLKKYGLSSENTIFAMVGQVMEVKGSKFVLRAFMKHANKNSRLLIVGNDDHAYAKECKKMSEEDDRIIFCGELKDTRGIYRISDYIMRGDPQYCIGRTIYEGLFSGAGVIIPGHEQDLEKMQSGEELRDKIHFYEPGNAEALTKVIKECSEHRMTDREFRSNIKDYMEQYKMFVDKIVRKEGDT